MNEDRKIRVLVAKVGLDGHDKGAFLITRILRDAGMEAIYTGLRRTVDQVVASAIQEDVDVIGLSLLSGAHLSVAEKMVKRMKEEGIDDKLIVVGGVIPEEDIPKLKEIGVGQVFTQSSDSKEIVESINSMILG